MTGTQWAGRPTFIDHADQPPACQGHDPDLWFPEPGQRGKTRQAKAICARCPHTDACRDWATAQPRVVGIWGGTTQAERRTRQRRHHDGQP